MKMKFLLFLLAAMLLTTSAMAVQVPTELMELLQGGAGGNNGEPIELVVKEEALHLYKDVIGPSGVFAAIIENPGTVPAAVQSGTVDLLDKDGNVITSVTIYGSTPYIIAPGGTAYVQQEYLQVSEEDAARVASHKFTVNGVTQPDDTPPAPATLPVTSTYAQEEVPNYFGEEKNYSANVTLTIENNTDATAYNAQAFSVLRNKDGKLLTVATTMANDIGILPGSKIEMQNRVNGGLVAKLMAEQSEPATVESVVLVMPEL